jgi:hypothetical protein
MFLSPHSPDKHCHVERSETSQIIGLGDRWEKKQKFFALLRMTVLMSFATETI